MPCITLCMHRFSRQTIWRPSSMTHCPPGLLFKADGETPKNTHSMALSKFRLGLARQVELRGLEALEQECREDARFKPTRGSSSLQIQVAHHYKHRQMLNIPSRQSC